MAILTLSNALTGTGTLSLSTPVSYRVFQRSGTTGSIAITGTYTGTPGPVEASFNGGSYSQICDTPAGGVFSGTLAGQAQGQGVLSVRWVGNGGNTATRTLVAVSDVFICGGQSNMVGEAEAYQSWSHASLKPCLFGNDYSWKELYDPYDDATGQVDAVSEDDLPYGSFIQRLATNYMAATSLAPCFVPCARGGTAITAWQPGANHQDRNTLYGSMIYRALQTGAKCVLWWQGENEAMDATTESEYNDYLDNIANAVNADLGVKLMVCKLEILNDAPWVGNTTKINNAINTAWGDNSNVLVGPDFSAADWGGAHFPAAQANTVGDAWWAALAAAFGW